MAITAAEALSNFAELSRKVKEDKREFLLYKLACGSSLAADALGIPLDTFKKEIPIIRAGPSQKRWLSSRLLLGLSEQEAIIVYNYS